MPEVTLKINHRGYSLSCDVGQEQRLVDLSHYVDSRLQDIAKAGAATHEAHLLVLTALVMADEVYELRDEVESLREEMQHIQGQSHGSWGGNSELAEHEAAIAHAIEHLAGKIEQIASRVKHGNQAVDAA